MKRMSTIAILCLSCCAQAAPQSGNSELSQASELVAEGSATVVYGSLSALAASGDLVVRAVEVTGDASVIVLAGSVESGGAAIRLSGEAARGLSIAAGTAVGVMALSTGYVLVSAGKVVAFIPNELGKALLHHTRADAPRGR